MSERFDPYRDWLGVVSHTNPPSHYELLGIAPSAANPAGVAEAYRRQKGRLGPHLAGQRGVIAQRLLAQLEAAQRTLLSPDARQAYDASLGAGETPKVSAPREPAGAADALLPPRAVPAGPPQRPTVAMATLISPPGSAPALRPPPVRPLAAAQAAIASAPQAAAGAPQAVGPVSAPLPIQPGAGEAAPASAAAGLPQVATQERSAGSYRRGRGKSPMATIAAGLAAAALAVFAAVYLFRTDQPLDVTRGVPPRDDARAASRGDAGVPDKPESAATRLVERPATARAESPGGSPGRRPPRRAGGSRRASATLKARRGTAMAGESASGEPGRVDGGPMVDGDEPQSGSNEPVDDDDPPSEQGEPAMEEALSAGAAGSGAAAVESADPQAAARIERGLASARAALARRDLAAAQEQLHLAMLEVESAELEGRIDRAMLLAGHVERFWKAVGQGLAGLEAAEELEVNGQVINVVESNAESLVVRAGGRNRTYTVEKLPPALALVLAGRSLPKEDAASKVALGAFHAVDERGDSAEARRLWQEAAALGADIEPLLAELDRQQ